MKNLITILCVASQIAILSAQEITINVELNRKYTVGDVSTFDRKKFITIHESIGSGDWGGNNEISDLRDHFLNGYDVYLGRNTGGISWILNTSKEDPTRSGFADPADIAPRGVQSRADFSANATYHDYMDRIDDWILAAQKTRFWPDGQQTNNGWAISRDEPLGQATGEFMGRYIKEFLGGNGHPLPNWVEVMNEPVYKLATVGTEDPDDIFRFHSTVASEIKKLNPNIVVGGAATITPTCDEDNFARWERIWKSFMDIAGEDMDFWSFHIYDWPARGGKEIYKRGSNIEAIFDMLEHYSMLSFGKVKPFVISEYGAFWHDLQKQPWTPARDWLHLKAVNSMMLSFMDRANLMAKALPFVMLKAEWGRTTVPYTHRLMRQAFEKTGETGEHWVYTEMVKTYELWSDVNGTRLYTTTSDPDIQIDAYFSGNTAYVILNNLYFEDKEIGVNLIDAGDNAVQSINMRHLYLQGGEVVLDDETLASDQTTVTISDEAAIILKYTFENPISPANQCDEVKYYADDYFREITAGQPEQFNINNVALGDTGAAVLRLGLGRAHGRSLQPIVTVNGATLPVPENFMGYDQKPRETFWGVIDVPVPYDVLQANNAVSVGFVDNGGHISSVTMRVFNFNEDSISSVGSESNKVETVYPNPAINFLNINSVKQIHRVRIFNTIGQERKIQRNMDRIDISSLAAGVYLLKIEFVGGGSSVVKFTKINR